MNNNLLVWPIFLLCLLLPLFSYAVQSRNGFWSQLIINGKADTYLYAAQPQLRFNEGNVPIDEYLLDLSVGKRKKPWTMWLGLRYEIKPLDTEPNVHEMRLWEQLNWENPADPDLLKSRTRLEQRKAFHFPQIAHRLRQQFTVASPYQYGLRMVCSDEIFINLNSVPWVTTKTWNQNRFYLGVEHEVSNRITAGMGYLYQYVFSSPAQSNNVLQMTLAFAV